MPRNVSGSYTLPGAVNPVVSNDLITANWANTTLNDVASSLTNSLDRTGNGVMQAQLRLFDTGGAAAPPLAFAGDTNTGLYPVAADQLGVSLGGTLSATFAPTALTLPNAVFPIWAGTPTLGSHLVNKTYTDATFATSATVATTLRGNWALLSDVAVTNVATIDFDNGVGGVVLDTTYDDYIFIISNVQPVAGGDTLALRVSVTSIYQSTGYGHSGMLLTTGTSTWTGMSAGSGQNQIVLCQAVPIGASERGLNGVISFTGPSLAKFPVFASDFTASNTSTASRSVTMGFRSTAAATTGIRLFFQSGNFAAGGNIRLYGRRKT
jgi:hypothetical protein